MIKNNTYFIKLIEQISNLCIKFHISPNQLTIIGAIGCSIGALFLVLDQRYLAIFFITIFTLFDAIDGSIARIQNKQSALGKYLDSNFDRVVDTIIFFSILTQVNQNNIFEIYLVVGALAVSLLTSYIKASSEIANVTISNGPLGRAPRIALVLLAIFTKQYIFFLTIIIILGSLTVLIRLFSGINKIKN
ncbi:MAG: CDP-alcohol phosphatidyltransferase family protein [Dehalococcoidia bacterium]|jgi:phosphatidylglycerophosphate synthase|nr:MAG: Phosphatidylglycerophosphate synthase [Chloroflexota bacterium]|tara:strand:+ start:9169 stop:9738 length:570 start_codon:yes stop_codon:yes gene_type:complete